MRSLKKPRHAFGLLCTMLLVITGCSGVGSGSGPQERVVRVDYRHDEFVSYFLEYFPRSVTVRQGDTVNFKQEWTGEPHSVTMGTLVDKMMNLVEPYIQMARRGEEIPDDEPPEVAEASKPLPWMSDFETGQAAQNGAQPCYLDTGVPPTDSNTPCPKRSQPAFNGRQSFYNSGFIPYEGPRGNQFKVKIAQDTKPGTYFYYCNYHGPFMSGKINVRPAGAEIPSADAVNEQALKEIRTISAPLLDMFRQARRGKVKSGNLELSGNFAGLSDEKSHGGINEFIPRTIKVKTGEKVTWKFIGPHTVSFNVPPYFPIITVKKDGTVERNPKLDPPAGGAPPLPEPPEGPPGGPEGPGDPPAVDAGTWNGKGFFSSGVFYGGPYALYSMRFSKPGTYKYACLIHPAMVGTIEVG